MAADTFFDTGLVAGAYYYYEVSCINSLGESPKSSAVGSTTGFPGNVAAKGVSASGISVTWNPVAGAALYNAYRSESDTGAFLAVGLVANDTFVDTGLSAGKVYYYEVSATGGSQESPLSGAVWGITIAAAPFGLKIDSVFAKTARIVWQADTGASSYTVYRRPNDTAAFAAVGVSASDTFTDTGLSPATRYSYAVSAVNVSGESQKSAPAGLLTIPAAPQIAVDSALSRLECACRLGYGYGRDGVQSVQERFSRRNVRARGRSRIRYVLCRYRAFNRYEIFSRGDCA